MKPMSAPPAPTRRERLENDRARREAHRLAAEREQIERDRLKTTAPESSPLDCIGCGDSYQFGKGFIFDGKTGECYCPDCFREYANHIERSGEHEKHGRYTY